MNRMLLIVLAAAAAGCRRPPDRLATDGGVVAGRLVGMAGTTVEFEGFSVEVPGGSARVLLRSGALYEGAVTLSDGDLAVDQGDMTARAALRDVAVVSWGATSVSGTLLDVHAASGWTDTHLLVREGAQLLLVAGGCASLPTGTSGPGGLDRTATGISLAPEARDGSLIARIGPDGPVFTVGESWSGAAPASGGLLLAVNTPAGEGSGFYTVSVNLETPDGGGHAALYPARR